MTFLIIAFALLILANIFGLIYLRSNLRGIQQENNSIYEREIESRKSKEIEPENLSEEIGVDTTLTSWDLDDIDRTHESHF